MDNDSREQLLDHMRQEISRANGEIAELREQLAEAVVRRCIGCGGRQTDSERECDKGCPCGSGFMTPHGAVTYLHTMYETTSTAGKNISKALDEALHTITVLRADLAAARANAIDLTRLSQSEVFDLVQAALAHLDKDSLWKVRKLVAVAEETKAGKW